MLALSLALTLASGQIAAGPRSAHLLDEVVAQLPPAPMVSAEPVSVAQLTADIAAVQRLRPNLVGGIVTLVIGAGLSVGGGLYMGLGLSLASLTSGLEFIAILGGVVLAVGLPLLLVGTWALINRLGELATVNAELTELKRQLQLQRQLEQAPPTPRAEAALPTAVLAAF